MHDTGPGAAGHDRLSDRPPATGRHLVVLSLAGLLLYGVALGDRGFQSTEGHRILPAWAMLDGSSWTTPQLFDRPYLRKPPAFAWLAAGSAELFGRTEFAARFPAALAAVLTALAAYAVGRRWFGPTAGLAAGWTQLLTPLFWASARSADIEAPHDLAALLVGVFMIACFLEERARRTTVDAAWATAAGLAVAGMVLLKGPAGLPLAAAVLLVWARQEKSVAVLTDARLWTFAGSALLPLGLFAAVAVGDWPTGPTPGGVQSLGDFLWQPSKLFAIAVLPANVLLWALPTSIALLCPWTTILRPIQRAADLEPEADGAVAADRATDGEADKGPPAEIPASAYPPNLRFVSGEALRMARHLGKITIVALALYTLAGVWNPRYAMPAVVLLPVLAGFAWLRWSWQHEQGLDSQRWTTAAAWHGLQRPARLVAVGVLIAAVWIGAMETRRAGRSGKELGERFARSMRAATAEDPKAGTVQVWADDAVEARPEILLYARRLLTAEGVTLDVRWRRPAVDGWGLPPVGHFVLLSGQRGANESGSEETAANGEVAAYLGAGLLGSLREIDAGGVHKYRFTLFQAMEPGRRPSDGAPLLEPYRERNSLEAAGREPAVKR
ncbi:MAG: ArnT family glycosyltransferase [Planctomycetia bacterium]